MTLRFLGFFRSRPFSFPAIETLLISKPRGKDAQYEISLFLENLDNGEKINYKIVGKDEADLKKKLIYFMSPIGKGLIGKNMNDLVEIKTPAGTKNFEIKDVKYI